MTNSITTETIPWSIPADLQPRSPLWQDGMLVSSQHFELFGQHLRSLSLFVNFYLMGHPWGLCQIQPLEPEVQLGQLVLETNLDSSTQSYHLEIKRCTGLMPTGQWVLISPEMTPQERNYPFSVERPTLPLSSEHFAYLSIRLIDPMPTPLADSSDALPLLSGPGYRLQTTSHPPSITDTSLLFARLRWETENQRYALDPTFLPPLLFLYPSHALLEQKLAPLQQALSQLHQTYRDSLYPSLSHYNDAETLRTLLFQLQREWVSWTESLADIRLAGATVEAFVAQAKQALRFFLHAFESGPLDTTDFPEYRTSFRLLQEQVSRCLRSPREIRADLAEYLGDLTQTIPLFKDLLGKMCAEVLQQRIPVIEYDNRLWTRVYHDPQGRGFHEGLLQWSSLHNTWSWDRSNGFEIPASGEFLLILEQNIVTLQVSLHDTPRPVDSEVLREGSFQGCSCFCVQLRDFALDGFVEGQPYALQNLSFSRADHYHHGFQQRENTFRGLFVMRRPN